MSLPARLLHGHRGKGLEITIAASQGSVVRLEQFPTPSKRIFKAGAWQVIQTKGPVDFIGEVCASGRAIHLDAKECDLATRFPVGNEDHFPEHQRQWLLRHGPCRAICGLLICATHPDIEKLYWLSWRHLRYGEPSIEWGDSRLVELGSSKFNVPFQKIVAAEPLEVRP